MIRSIELQYSACKMLRITNLGNLYGIRIITGLCLVCSQLWFYDISTSAPPAILCGKTRKRSRSGQEHFVIHLSLRLSLNLSLCLNLNLCLCLSLSSTLNLRLTLSLNLNFNLMMVDFLLALPVRHTEFVETDQVTFEVQLGLEGLVT